MEEKVVMKEGVKRRRMKIGPHFPLQPLCPLSSF